MMEDLCDAHCAGTASFGWGDASLPSPSSYMEAILKVQ